VGNFEEIRCFGLALLKGVSPGVQRYVSDQPLAVHPHEFVHASPGSVKLSDYALVCQPSRGRRTVLFRRCTPGCERQLQVLLRAGEAGPDGERTLEFLDCLVEPAL
jgi:hypothetical protein